MTAVTVDDTWDGVVVRLGAAAGDVATTRIADSVKTVALMVLMTSGMTKPW